MGFDGQPGGYLELRYVIVTPSAQDLDFRRRLQEQPTATNNGASNVSEQTITHSLTGSRLHIPVISTGWQAMACFK